MPLLTKTPKPPSPKPAAEPSPAKNTRLLKLLTDRVVSRPGSGPEYQASGSVIELNDADAARLIKAGQAEPAKAGAEPTAGQKIPSLWDFPDYVREANRLAGLEADFSKVHPHPFSLQP